VTGPLKFLDAGLGEIAEVQFEASLEKSVRP
jgi:hypothetical protein